MSRPELTEHVYDAVRGALDALPAEERDDIYVVSLFVYDEDDDPRLPTVTVSVNGEADAAAATGSSVFPPDEAEARWNFAFWRQTPLALICDSSADGEGARERWAREQRLWYELAADENAVFNPRGEPLTGALIAVLEQVVQRLHTAEIERIFGRPLPVLIHELEYYEEIAAQNLRANPPDVVPDEFVASRRGR